MNRTLGAALALLMAAGGAGAVTTCRIVSGESMRFGGYDVLSAVPNDSLARVSVICTRNGGPQNVTLTMQLSPGNGTSVNTRRMANSAPAGGFLNYGLFRDVGRSAPWGFSTGVDTVSQSIAIPNKDSEVATFTIYGRIPPLQDAAVGSYFDQVTITVLP